MGDPTRMPAGGATQEVKKSFELEDYVIERMKIAGVSVRNLAVSTGLKKSRLHEGLHRDIDKRIPLRVPEMKLVLDALGIDRNEAFYAREVLASVSDITFDEVIRVAAMLCEMNNGLPQEVITVIRAVDGLDLNDVRREHGTAARGLVVRLLGDRYTAVARLRRKTDGFED
ncbi:hypothetical protein [Sphingomonas sp. BK235]|uniref:hypothetical protein n=1 Tax=Sphingomonas sp. BK235 TaxID=2512131 RepID=UPI001045869D|nr:hypothetical protein [Sphingomonas sp. BK235]